MLNPNVNIFIDRMEPTEEDWNIISQILDNDDEQESANQENKIIYTAYKLDGTSAMDISSDGDNSLDKTSAESSNCSINNNAIDMPNSDSDKDMDIPLASLKRDYSKQSRRALFKQDIELESEEEHDENVKDPTFKLSKKDINSTDSEQEDKPVRRNKKKQIFKQQKHRNKKETVNTTRQTESKGVKIISHKVQKTPARNTNWKRKATQLSRRKRVTPGRPQTARDKINKAIDRAMQESFNQHRIRQLVQQRHIQNLNVLLNSNGI